jgi:ribosomal protein S27E
MNKKYKYYIDCEIGKWWDVVKQLSNISDTQKKINDNQNKLNIELSNQVAELKKDKLDKVLSDSYNTWFNSVAQDFYLFKEKMERSPQTVIANCKICKHPTVHLMGADNKTRCLNCGTIWQTTKKEVTEVKVVK